AAMARSRIRTSALVLAPLTLLALAGCIPQPPALTPATPQTTPPIAPASPPPVAPVDPTEPPVEADGSVSPELDAAMQEIVATMQGEDAVQSATWDPAIDIFEGELVVIV